MAKEKIAITLERGTLAQIKAQVRARQAASVSAYISTALEAQLEADAIARLVEDLRQEHGKPSREDKAWARAVFGR